MPKGDYQQTEEFRQKKYEEVEEFVKSQGYVLASDRWVNYTTKYDFVCPEGHHLVTTYYCFYQHGTRCSVCRREKERRRREDKFKELLAAEDYKWDEETFKYVNNKTKIPATCPKGHMIEVAWESFVVMGCRCQKCSQHLPQEEVAKRFEREGCELLSEYMGSDTPVKFRCVCGTVAHIYLWNFEHGARCPRCAGEKARMTMRKNRLEKLRIYAEKEGIDNTEKINGGNI